MLNRLATLCGMAALITGIMPGHITAQSFEDGKRLFQDGVRTFEAAGTKEELEKAERILQEALTVFEAIGHLSAQGKTCAKLAKIAERGSERAEAEALYSQALDIQNCCPVKARF